MTSMDAQVPQALLDRHAAFWDAGARIMLRRVSEYRPLSDGRGIPLADGSRSEEGQVITPEMVEPRLFYGDEAAPFDLVRDGFMAGASPPGLCWTEAILGCTVRIVTGGPWAEPFDVDWRHPSSVMPDERWLARLEEFVVFLAERASGRHPVGQPLMRGPVDMMASAMGHEAMCVAFCDEPVAAAAFLDRCADVFLETAERRLAHSPAFAGGYLSGYGIWAPGTVVRTQVDNATMLSPDLYRRHVLPADRRVMEAFDYPLIHLHSGCLHVVDALLEVEALRAIQVSVDHPGGPLAHEIMPILRRLAGRKSLIVTGPVDREELSELDALAELGSLCLEVSLLPDSGG